MSYLVAPSKVSDQHFLQLSELSPLTRLASLRLADAQAVTAKSLGLLRCLTSLQSLDLSGCNGVAGQGLSDALASLASLSHLSLDGCHQVSMQFTVVTPLSRSFRLPCQPFFSGFFLLQQTVCRISSRSQTTAYLGSHSFLTYLS